MAKPSDTDAEWREQRNRIIGLGERSVRKNYYPLLRRNLTDLRVLLQAAQQTVSGILVCNRAAVIQYVNPAFCTMMEVRSEFLVGRTLNWALADSGAAEVWQQIEQAVAAGEPWQGEIALRRKSGEEWWNQMAMSPVRDDAGTITHYVGMFSDVTDRWQAAERMRQANEELERRVAERTRELRAINRQLADAKRQADQANQSKTRFLAAASHDLLQPLNAARLFGTLLAARRLAPANRELLHNTLVALDTTDEILTALLDISKLDAGALPVAIADFPVAELFAGLAEQSRLLADRKGLRLHVVPSTLWVRSDRRLLSRILYNYVANAIRYTPSGGRVLVGCRRHGGSVLLGVWDTGPGVPEDKREEIFEEFRRLHDGGEQGERGVGLGLAIVRRMADLLDHPLVLQSTVGRGSLFGIELPPVASPPAIDRRSPVSLPKTGPAYLRGATVVALDDDPSGLAGMTALLTHWGCRTVAGADGAAVLEQMRGRLSPPDFIIADYHLQNGALGLAAIGALRDLFGAAIPAVVVTADHGAETAQAILSAGCHFLAKPLRPAKLGSLMAQLLRSSDPS